MDKIITVVLSLLIILIWVGIMYFGYYLPDKKEQAEWKKRKVYTCVGYFRDPDTGELEMINPKPVRDSRHTDCAEYPEDE